MQIAAQHAEAVGQCPGMDVKKRLLLDGIALHARGVSPRDIEPSAAIEADLANPSLSLGNWALVATRKAANAVVVERGNQRRIGLLDSFVENVAQGGHRKL